MLQKWWYLAHLIFGVFCVWCGKCAKYLAFGTFATPTVNALTLLITKFFSNYLTRGSLGKKDNNNNEGLLELMWQKWYNWKWMLFRFVSRWFASWDDPHQSSPIFLVRIRLMYTRRAYIIKSVFEKNLLGIKKTVKIFSISDKTFSKNDILLI